MNIGHLDCSSGASGDMWLGALAAVGAPVDMIERAVAGLGVGSIRFTWAPVRRAGISAIAVTVSAPPEPAPTRTWSTVTRILEAAQVPHWVRSRALAVFRRLAETEAAVHGVPIDDVHFHEVGAVDALADVVGACAGLAALGLDELTCGPVAVGLPPPAVVPLLTGFPIIGGGVNAELCTPTGAALLAEFARPVDEWPAMWVRAQGFGAGTRELDRPNVLRFVVGTSSTACRTDAAVLETTIDDLSGELVAFVLDRLRAAGAHDAWATPVLMKKGRPGYTLSALADPADIAVLQDVLFSERTTIGCRWYSVQKLALTRSWVRITVGGCLLRVKIAERDGEVVTAAPEFDDVRAAAETLGRAAREVYDEACMLARRRLRASPPTPG